MVIKCLPLIHFSGALSLGFKSLIFQFNARVSISADAGMKLSPKSVFHPVSLPWGHPSGTSFGWRGDVPAPTRRQAGGHRAPNPSRPLSDNKVVPRVPSHLIYKERAPEGKVAGTESYPAHGAHISLAWNR